MGQQLHAKVLKALHARAAPGPEIQVAWTINAAYCQYGLNLSLPRR